MGIGGCGMGLRFGHQNLRKGSLGLGDTLGYDYFCSRWFLR